MKPRARRRSVGPRRLWFHEESESYIQTLTNEEVTDALAAQCTEVTQNPLHEVAFIDQLIKEGNKMALNFGKPKAGATPSSKKQGAFKFEYKARSTEQMHHQATRRIGGGGASAVQSDIKEFRPKAGDHEFRILPPTWEDAEHFGIDVWIHYAIGADNSSYLCVKKMFNEPCACCDERTRASKDGEDQLADDLSPTPRVAFYMIDRKAEADGPIVWLSPAKKVHQQIMLQARNKKTGEYLNLDDPDAGYDIEMTIEGQGISTQYGGIKASRDSSPLSDDEDTAVAWLKFITDNPLPDVLVKPDYDDVMKALEGGVRVSDRKAEEGATESGGGKPKASKPTSGKPMASKPKAETKTEEEGDEPTGGEDFDPTVFTWHDVNNMNEEQVEELIAAAGLDEADFAECKNLAEAKDIICQRLGIRKPKKVDKEEEGGWAAKLAKFKKTNQK